jgi:hypothetical protein
MINHQFQPLDVTDLIEVRNHIKRKTTRKKSKRRVNNNVQEIGFLVQQDQSNFQIDW